jgi:ribosomal protein S18 acetylase RimI-like enzyme
VIIIPATDEDIRPICKEIASKSKYIRDFSNHIFSGPTQVAKGWVRKAVDETTGELLGFTCVRHKVREPVTELYFIGVKPNAKRLKIGASLIQDLIETSPHRAIELNVMKENEEAINLYLKLGFLIAGESMKGKSHRMRFTW